MKPLGRKNYGSIPHLPSSRMGPSDHHCHQGQEAICTTKTRDTRDVIIVLEKVDGSNVGIARVGDHIFALGRSGHLAQSSKYEQHQLFATWVREREACFHDMLEDGERLIGEWMAQAHGTRYRLPLGPFVAFDIMIGDRRLPFSDTSFRCAAHGIALPSLLHAGGPITVADAMALHQRVNAHGWHDDDGPEGVVYRVERHDSKTSARSVDFLAKWVRPDKMDGKYLPGVCGNPSDAGEVWNWRPRMTNSNHE